MSEHMTTFDWLTKEKDAFCPFASFGHANCSSHATQPKRDTYARYYRRWKVLWTRLAISNSGSFPLKIVHLTLKEYSPLPLFCTFSRAKFFENYWKIISIEIHTIWNFVWGWNISPNRFHYRLMLVIHRNCKEPIFICAHSQYKNIVLL